MTGANTSNVYHGLIPASRQRRAIVAKDSQKPAMLNNKEKRTETESGAFSPTMMRMMPNAKTPQYSSRAASP